MAIKVNVSSINYGDEGANQSCFVDVRLRLEGGKPTDRMDKLSTLVAKISEIEL
ncbi:hypothetical protein [Streptococcus marmotae]|uniref:hypothetical protein n=1 Tax=Streptococcus marmotae TaxID=1825069 RepID=UPI000AE484EF|nr:hypothetical protein [Streptococcus marmotae]